MKTATAAKPARKPAASKTACKPAKPLPKFLKGMDPRIIEMYEVAGRLKRVL